MLTTLCKHEIKATARTFIWLYIAFAVIAVVNAVMFITGGGGEAFVVQSRGPGGAAPEFAEYAFPTALRVIFMALYVLSIAAMSITTLVVVILRFYRNLLGDEGYLMFTLPVNREQHILSKLLVAVMWVVCSAVLIILSFLLLTSGSGVIEEISNGLKEFRAAGVPVDRWIFFGVLSLVICSFTGVLMLYAAMAIGPNLLKNRVGGSILAYIIIYVINQIAGFSVIFGAIRTFFGFGFAGGPTGRTVSVANDTITVTGAGDDFAAGHQVITMTGQDIAGVDTVFLSCIVWSVAVGICCWFITRYMLKKKLNLA